MTKADDRRGRLRWTFTRKREAPPELVRIGVAIGGMLFLALAIAVIVAIAGLRFLHFKEFKPEPQLSAGTLYNLLKVAFAFAAGVGGVVALVISYRRQRVAEFDQKLSARAENREVTRLFNERFATAAGQLSHEAPALRLAGVYAMASLAGDWIEQRQTCVDVLCAQIRLPYEPEPAPNAPALQHQAFRAVREVRHTVIRVIATRLQDEHLRSPKLQDWRGLDFDFSGAVLDGGNFRSVQFTGGTVSFNGAQFVGGKVNFMFAWFAGSVVDFNNAHFAGGLVDFTCANFVGGMADFFYAQFSGATVDFRDCTFTGTELGGGAVRFISAEFTGGMVDFAGAKFSGGMAHFNRAHFVGGSVRFRSAEFNGGAVDFSDAEFTGSTVDFTDTDWSVPPRLPSWKKPPAGVTLPAAGPTTPPVA